MPGIGRAPPTLGMGASIGAVPPEDEGRSLHRRAFFISQERVLVATADNKKAVPQRV